MCDVMSKKIKGTVVISRLHGHKEVVEIRFKDEASCVTFATAQLTLEQFARAVTNLSTPDVDMEVDRLRLVGRKRVVRTEAVSLGSLNAYDISDEESLAACQDVMNQLKEETGLDWVPNLSDLGNPHRAVKGANKHRVMFTAYEKKNKK